MKILVILSLVLLSFSNVYAENFFKSLKKNLNKSPEKKSEPAQVAPTQAPPSAAPPKANIDINSFTFDKLGPEEQKNTQKALDAMIGGCVKGASAIPSDIANQRCSCTINDKYFKDEYVKLILKLGVTKLPEPQATNEFNNDVLMLTKRKEFLQIAKSCESKFPYVASVQDQQASVQLVGAVMTSQISTTEVVNIYSSDSDSIFLGCLNCKSFDINSVFNLGGKYGSKAEVNSIRNKVGIYGDTVSSTSPCNRVATSPPNLISASGINYGKLSINKAVPYQNTSEHVQKFLGEICN
jgi:hypothetical protein